MTLPVSFDVEPGSGLPIPVTITIAERGAKGETGDPGADSTVPGPQGDRGSLFLGSYATSSSLPTIDGDTVRIGDFAYVEDTGELWRAA